METPSAEDKREAHIRGIKVTAFSSILGILAGVASWFLMQAGFDQIFGVYVLMIAIALQQPFLPYLGKDEMSTKDWLYVGFMTFDLWFVSWTILLTA